MARKVETNKGVVEIEGPVRKDYLIPLKMNEGLNNFRNPARQKEALLIVADLPDGMVYIARHEDEIVGYLLFHSPNPYGRWHRHPRILELGAIEVSRYWQKRGIATELLKEAFSNPIMEDYIVIATEFYWHWDLKGSGLDVWGYQKMLRKLYGTVNFKRRHTDDPEILEHPANMLMVRFGSNVTPAHIKFFEDLTYQQSIFE